ncbi:hypothetical protein FHX80_112607 [Streptomyces brevispora]|uniref:Uncharacterized protein n=1 Tax=Streptomyces brevispora TaxID=887462 RepID=A0A561UXR5_9ACTN|nr:hypothetical protein FHX80_112607 [Streptomyces brevispora]
MTLMPGPYGSPAGQALSCVKVESVTEQAAKAAAELLKGAGVHGHKCATVAEVAPHQPKPVALLTSANDEIAKLCGNQARIPLCPRTTRSTRLARLAALPTLVPHPCPAERTTAVR